MCDSLHAPFGATLHLALPPSADGHGCPWLWLPAGCGHGEGLAGERSGEAAHKVFILLAATLQLVGSCIPLPRATASAGQPLLTAGPVILAPLWPCQAYLVKRSPLCQQLGTSHTTCLPSTLPTSLEIAPYQISPTTSFEGGHSNLKK